MAALDITEVQLGFDAAWRSVRFGGSASLGDIVYRGSEQLWYQATSTKTALEAGLNELGILLNGVDVEGQYGVVVTAGTVYLVVNAATVADGVTYILGSTAGSLHPDSDGASGWYKSVFGVGGDAAFGAGASDEFIVDVFASGIQIP